MNSIKFYTQYDKLAADYLTFKSNMINMEDKDIRVKEKELSQQRNELFADFTASQLNILV